jgi:hypothetical protein
MKIMKTVTIPPVPEKTKEVVSHVLCDLCGAVGKSGYSGEADWKEADDWESTETSVLVKTGCGNSEGGHFKLELFHICPSCFREKLVPWLESQGGKPSRDEIDW